MERDAWAEHFRMIAAGTGSVDDRAWAMFLLIPRCMLFGETPLPPMNCMLLLANVFRESCGGGRGHRGTS